MYRKYGLRLQWKSRCLWRDSIDVHWQYNWQVGSETLWNCDENQCIFLWDKNLHIRHLQAFKDEKKDFVLLIAVKVYKETNGKSSLGHFDKYASL